MSIVDKMEFLALDENFYVIAILDAYDSMIWTDKYNAVGDFEVQGPNNEQMRLLVNDAKYIFNSVTKTLMVVEIPEGSYDDEEGNSILVKGRSFTSILDRRVVLSSKTIFNPTDARISQIIWNAINDRFGSGAAPNRQWDKLSIVNSTSADSAKLAPDTALQLTIGDNLLDVVLNLCVSADLGIRFELTSVNYRTVKCTIYEGVDRSVQGDKFIMFSDFFDTLSTLKETEVRGEQKNTMLVVGNAVDAYQQPILPQMIESANYTGLNRREMFFKANQDNVVYNVDGTVNRNLTNSEYISAIKRAGSYELKQPRNKIYREYAGDIVESENCQYGVNYSLGDIVSFWMPHGKVTTARLDTVTFSDDSREGKTVVPNFSFL